MPKVDFRIRVLKTSKPSPKERTITGWAAVVTRDDGKPVIDSDDHRIPVEVLKRAVQNSFARASGAGKVGVNHEKGKRGSGDLVESLVITKEVREAFDLGTSGREGWIASIRVTDPKLIKQIDSGELAELSLKGAAKGKWK
jgi:hypothetical protein